MLMRELLTEIETGFEFHDELNPALWDGEALHPEVKAALDKIAVTFIEYLGVQMSAVKDVVLTGSNCAFNWTSKSDVDLHIIVDMSKNDACPACTGDFVRDCFQAKKSLWNDSHDVTVKGFPVELYAQDAAEQHISPGVFSLVTNGWVVSPKKVSPTFDDSAVQAKTMEFVAQIDDFIEGKSDDLSAMKELKARIKKMRKAGLERAGIYSTENLAFKALRNGGHLGRLSDYEKGLEDKTLSLA